MNTFQKIKAIAFFTVIFLFPALYKISHSIAVAKIDKIQVRQPLVRIGLLRNSRAAQISTKDAGLIASQPRAAETFLNTTSVRISSRGYQPDSFELYQVEIPNIADRKSADNLAQSIRSNFQLPTSVSPNQAQWRVRIGETKFSRSAAEGIIAALARAGFEDAEIVSEKFLSPSDDAINLSAQISRAGKSKVRSLMSPRSSVPPKTSSLIQRISDSQATSKKNRGVFVNPKLREVVVIGRTPESQFSTLRPVTISSSSGGIIYLNGKRYRGKMEVFVNDKGRISVINVVPIEEYLLGVVPAELSLPAIEAQKAQAVAARTYAIANKDGYRNEGFDMLSTVWSQVYKGVGIETKMGTQAVRDTRGIVATYNGKPINALYTSTCGGRTEDSKNIFEFDHPYLRGVDCALGGAEHFTPFLIKSGREPALMRNEANYDLVRLASRMAVNNFLMVTRRFDDDYFEDPPSEIELISWLNQVAIKFDKPLPRVVADSARPLQLGRILHQIIYPFGAAEATDTLLSESDIAYHLSFRDASEVPAGDRLILATLLRDGWFSIHSDLTIKPKMKYSRGKILRAIDNIFARKKWSFPFQSGTAKASENGKLNVKTGRTTKEFEVDENLFLFRKFGDAFYQVKETAILGGENITYKTNSVGKIIYLAVEPISKTTVAERMSPFTLWKKNLSAATVRARLGKYVKGMGTLIDLNIKSKGFSRRATELEIITTKGIHSLKGGKIRSALRLNEQLFVIDKKYGRNHRVVSYNFTGRGWGHGVGMCQYGAYGFAKMGLDHSRILKHYYSGIELTKLYN